MRRGGIAAAVVAASLLLSSCAPVYAVIGAAIGVAYTDWQTVDKDGSAILAADAGLKKDLCARWDPALHNAMWDAKVSAYCANIPTTVLGAVRTAVKVIHAKPPAQQAALQPPTAPPPPPPPPAVQGQTSDNSNPGLGALGVIGALAVGAAALAAYKAKPPAGARA